MIPIGRGQRELIIGDRQTGKTAIATDTIINQKGKDVTLHLRCHRPEALHRGASSSDKLEKSGAMDYTIVVCRHGFASWRRMQYIAPYAGCTMGEYFMRPGQGRPHHL